MKKSLLIPAICFCLFAREYIFGFAKITDGNNIFTYTVDTIIKPTTYAELSDIVKTAAKPIACAGARYSQGGHIAVQHGTTIDMSAFNRVIYLDKEKQTIRVQAGITWKEIQEYIDPYDLSVLVMQSYNDFSVGGSLAVNVHGRELHYGQLIGTVESLTVMLADGALVKASRQENYDLFRGIIGGYGKLGIIVEATLQLTTNKSLKRNVTWLHVHDYQDHFEKEILNNPKVVLHNANLYPDDFTRIASITWLETHEPCTQKQRLQKREKRYPFMMLEQQLVRRLAPLKSIRPFIEHQRFSSSCVVKRNYEMSYSVNQLKPLIQFPTVCTLQEYFIPVHYLEAFITALRHLTKKYNANVLNASIRYVPANQESALTYAPVDSFAIVLYINTWRTQEAKALHKVWTQELIDVALALNGTYYLPYQLLASREQFFQAYPNSTVFAELEATYDPTGTFSNSFWQHYSR